jgi:selenocysteine lyase/cysteine desulfurase
VVFSHEDAARNVLIREQMEAEGIHIAERDEKLRISPHLYNTLDEIDEVTHLLARLA